MHRPNHLTTQSLSLTAQQQQNKYKPETNTPIQEQNYSPESLPSYPAFVRSAVPARIYSHSPPNCSLQDHDGFPFYQLTSRFSSHPFREAPTTQLILETTLPSSPNLYEQESRNLQELQVSPTLSSQASLMNQYHLADPSGIPFDDRLHAMASRPTYYPSRYPLSPGMNGFYVQGILRITLRYAKECNVDYYILSWYICRNLSQGQLQSSHQLLQFVHRSLIDFCCSKSFPRKKQVRYLAKFIMSLSSYTV